jgi:hypothetical protein
MIVCVNTAHPHRHIVSVGVLTDDSSEPQILSVDEVLHLIVEGKVLETLDRDGQAALVSVFECQIDGCKVPTIRTAPDGVEGDNLDYLSSCAAPSDD